MEYGDGEADGWSLNWQLWESVGVTMGCGPTGSGRDSSLGQRTEEEKSLEDMDTCWMDSGSLSTNHVIPSIFQI